MIRTFYVEHDKVPEVKKLIRKHNLYHVKEPLLLFERTEFKIEGDASQFLAFDIDYISLFPKEEPKYSLLGKFKNWLER